MMNKEDLQNEQEDMEITETMRTVGEPNGAAIIFAFTILMGVLIAVMVVLTVVIAGVLSFVF